MISMAAYPYPVLFVSVLLLVLPIIQAGNDPDDDGVVYTVTNNAVDTVGGLLFRDSLDEVNYETLMKSITHFVWNRVLRQEHYSERIPVKVIKLFIDKVDPVDHQFEDGVYEVHVNQKFLNDLWYSKRNEHQENNYKDFKSKVAVQTEVRWMLTFGIASFLQWKINDGDDQHKAIRDGIAAFAVMVARCEPGNWAKLGVGKTWDDKPDVTGRFFCYINKKKPDFVADLNEKMKTSYNPNYFKDVTGNTVDDWWSMYKKDYQNAT